MGGKCPTQEDEMTRICHIFPSLTYPGDPTSRKATAGESCRQREGAHHHLGPGKHRSLPRNPGKLCWVTDYSSQHFVCSSPRGDRPRDPQKVICPTRADRSLSPQAGSQKQKSLLEIYPRARGSPKTPRSPPRPRGVFY